VTGFWAIEWRQSGQFCGWICLRPGLDYRYAAEAQFQASDLELGYRLRRDCWGQGLATEASQALVPLAFDEPGIERVVSSALLDNRASWRVMEKCGLQRIGQFAIAEFPCGAVVYASTQPQWLPSSTAEIPATDSA
jgi:RimJ/RimL family protein N-acetyltransferase